MNAPPQNPPVRVWDLPTRLFHWALTLLIVMQYATGQFGALDMTWHIRGGYAILVLVLFRIAWGFAGSQTSRFAEFVRSPGAVWRYLRLQFAGVTQTSIGHNPLGGWSVIALLLSLVVQVASGLFARDDLDNEGPLAAHVSRQTVKLMRAVHSWNENVLLLLIALHVLAVLLYLLLGKQNLIVPMITGYKRADARSLRFGSARTALAVFALAAAAVALLVFCAGG